MPDKTMDDVSKLVSVARAEADWQCDNCNVSIILRPLADALESVAKENAELKEQRGKEANNYLKLINRVAHLDYDNADLTGHLANVAKERDALQEALTIIAEQRPCDFVTVARAALKKLNSSGNPAPVDHR